MKKTSDEREVLRASVVACEREERERTLWAVISGDVEDQILVSIRDQVYTRRVMLLRSTIAMTFTSLLVPRPCSYQSKLIRQFDDLPAGYIHLRNSGPKENKQCGK